MKNALAEAKRREREGNLKLYAAGSYLAEQYFDGQQNRDLRWATKDDRDAFKLLCELRGIGEKEG